MRNFEVINREYVNPVDLTVLGNTFNTLEQGHQKAVAAAAELETAIANLDLNEAESEWRQQKINEIRQTIEDNSNYGNAYSALDDIVRQRGYIESDPGLKGRLLSQQAYKKFNESIDANDELPDHYKEYYKRNNPYTYQDKYDSKGNILQGDTWKPTATPSKVIDNNDIMKLAIQYASPKKSNSQVARYYNQDGTITTQPKDKNATPVLYDMTTRQVIELTEDDLRKGLEAALNADPIAKQSLMQDWKIALDDYSNNREGLYNVVSPKGGSMTFNEFKESIFGPMYEAKSYRYVDETVTPNKNLVKDYNSAFGTGNSEKSNKNTYDGSELLNSPHTSPGDNIAYKDRSVITSMVAANNANKGLHDKLKSKFASGINSGNVRSAIDNIDLRNNDTFVQAIPDILGLNLGNIDYSDRDSVKTALINSNISEKDITDQLSLYDELVADYNHQKALNAEHIHNVNKYNEAHAGDKGWSAKQVMSGILSEEGVNSITADNKYIERFKKEWNQIVDAYFYPGSEYLAWQITDNTAYESFKTAIKGTPLENAIKYDTGKKGQKVIKLPAEHKNLLFDFADAIDTARSSRNMWHRFWQDIKGEFTNYGDNFYRDGEEYYIKDVLNTFAGRMPINNNILRTTVYYNKAEHVARGNVGQFINRIPFIGAATSNIKRGMTDDTGDKIAPIINFRNRLNRYSNEDNEAKDRTVQTINFVGASPRAIATHAEINDLMKDFTPTPDEREKRISDLKKIIQYEKELMIDELNITSFQNSVVKLKDKTGTYQPITSEDISKLGMEFQNDKKNADINITFNPVSAKYEHRIKFVTKDKDDLVERDFIIEPPQGSPLDRILNDDPNLNTIANFHLAQVEGRDIRLGGYNNADLYTSPKGDGIYEIGLENATDKQIIDTKTKDGALIYDVMTSLKTVLYRLNHFEDIYSGFTPEEQTKGFNDLANEYIQYMCILMGKNANNPNIVKTLYNDAKKESGVIF